MKIKLNISKDLKRNLKLKAREKELERNAYIYSVLDVYIDDRRSVWMDKIEHLMSLANSEEISAEDKAKTAMKKTTKKLQPLILNIDQKTYFALALIAKKSKKSKEALIVEILRKSV